MFSNNKTQQVNFVIGATKILLHKNRQREKVEEILKRFLESKRANLSIDPLLTNPLNSSTKLQISAT